jgi:hypothetical protein
MIFTREIDFIFLLTENSKLYFLPELKRNYSKLVQITVRFSLNCLQAVCVCVCVCVCGNNNKIIGNTEYMNVSG